MVLNTGGWSQTLKSSLFLAAILLHFCMYNSLTHCRVGHAVSLTGHSESKWLEYTSEMCFSFSQSEWSYVSFF